jgi:hypothetical protein
MEAKYRRIFQSEHVLSGSFIYNTFFRSFIYSIYLIVKIKNDMEK